MDYCNCYTKSSIYPQNRAGILDNNTAMFENDTYNPVLIYWLLPICPFSICSERKAQRKAGYGFNVSDSPLETNISGKGVLLAKTNQNGTISVVFARGGSTWTTNDFDQNIIQPILTFSKDQFEYLTTSARIFNLVMSSYLPTNYANSLLPVDYREGFFNYMQMKEAVLGTKNKKNYVDKREAFLKNIFEKENQRLLNYTHTLNPENLNHRIDLKRKQLDSEWVQLHSA